MRTGVDPPRLTRGKRDESPAAMVGLFGRQHGSGIGRLLHEDPRLERVDSHVEFTQDGDELSGVDRFRSWRGDHQVGRVL